jgi:hypothetical protein
MQTIQRVLLAGALLGVANAWLQAGDSAETKALLDKAIKAAGGQAKVDGLKNLAWKGKLSLDANGQEITVGMDGNFQGWDRQRLEVEVNVNGRTENLLLVINGKKGWVKNQNKINELGKELATFSDVVFAVRGPQLLTGLRDKSIQLSHLGEIKVGDQDAVGLRITRKGSPDLNIFFSKKTHLLLKADSRFTEPQGKEVEMEILFNEYKDFDGLKHFTKLTFKADGKAVNMEVSEVRPGAQFEANTFAKPE